MTVNSVLALALNLCLTLLLNAQTPSGFFTSESATRTAGNKILISVNKYNPTPEQIASAAKPKRNEPMTVLQIPVEATHLNLFAKEFECKLYCLDSAGKLHWEKTLGYSRRSAPAPLDAAGGFIFLGAPDRNKSEVIISKLAADGQLAWETRLDSLENVESITYAEDLVNILASFDHQEQKSNTDGTYSIASYPVYFFIQLHPETGKLIKKEYQMMGNYLSSLDYGYPLINTNYSYYLRDKDSIAFLTLMDQRKATIASEPLTAGSTIVAMDAGPESTHYLVRKKDGDKLSYHLYADFYGKKEKYQSPLPEPVRNDQRSFLLLDPQENAWTVIGQGASAQLYKTDRKGETSLVNKFAGDGTLVTSAGIMAGQTYLVILQGRDRPGKDGRLMVQILGL